MAKYRRCAKQKKLFFFKKQTSIEKEKPLPFSSKGVFHKKIIFITVKFFLFDRNYFRLQSRAIADGKVVNTRCKR